jgi:hypothetical protein
VDAGSAVVDKARHRNWDAVRVGIAPSPSPSHAHASSAALRLSLLLVLACSPATTRPSFLPNPQALVVVVDAPAATIVPEAVGWLVSQGFRADWSSPGDGYVETAWFNVRTRQSVEGADPGDLLNTIKIRCWADPNVPGKSQLTVEAIYRPILDPSRPERDLEIIVPQGSDGFRIAQQLIDAMTQKFGT